MTAVSAGTCTITATLSGAQGSAALTVNAKAVVSISITPGTQTLFLNSTLQFDAVATYNDGSVQDVTTATQWQSSAPSFVQVSNSGLVIAVAAGDATVSASNGTVVGSASVTVSSSNTGIAFIDDFTDSRLMLYWPGDGSVISYYGTRNSDGTIASITSATDSVAGQQPQTIVFDSQGEESTAILSDGTLIGFNWTANPTLVIIPPDQTGTAVIPLPAVTSAATVAADMHCSRTNAGCLSADARERNLAGTSPSSQYSQAISPEASGDATPSVAVTVTTDLGVGPKPEDNALVYVGIAYALGGSPVAPMPATETSPGTGVYTANLPSGPTALSPSVLQSSGAQALSTICKKIEALPNCGPKQTKCQIFTTLLTLVCDAQSVTQNYYTVLDLLNNLLPPVVAPNIVLNGCGMPQSLAAATGTYAFTAAAQCKPSQINVYLNPATVSVGGTIPLGATASWNSHQISSSALSWNWSAFSGSLQDSYLQISPRGTDTPEGWAGGKFSVAVADVLGQNPTPTDKPDIVTAVETNSDENGTDAITVQPTTLSLIVTWTVTGDVPTGWTGICLLYTSRCV